MENFVTYVVELPPELKIAIAFLVMLGIRALLAGRVPEQALTELAAVITTAVVGVIEVLLGLVPPEFSAVGAAILQLIVVLLGSVFVIRAYLTVRHSADLRGIRF